MKRINKIVGFVFCFLFASSFLFPVFAQNSSASLGMPVRPGDNPNFLGQNQYYSVVFRGNGEAVVTSKIIFSNLGKEKLSEITVQIPKVKPDDLTIYQVLASPTCIRYGAVPVGTLYVQPPCLEYQEPDYFQYYGNNKYQKADFDLKGDTLKIILPLAVFENKSGAFFVYFRANGYALKNFLGAWDYNFETLKTTDKIQNLQVGISTDSDLYLKGAQGTVDYRANEAVSSLKMDAGGAAPVASQAFDNFYNQIGQGSIIKTASSLAPSETYKVSGTYADSQIKLYSKEVAIGIGVILGVIIFISVISYLIMKKANKFLMVIGASLISSILVSLYSGVLFILYNYISSTNSYMNYQTLPFVLLMLGVVSLIVYSILIFGAALIVYSKYGITKAVATLVLTLVFTILFVGTSVLFMILTNNQRTPIVYPLMKGSGVMESVTAPASAK